MAAILQIKGPIAIPRTIAQCAKVLKSGQIVTSQQFHEAGHALQSLRLGSLVTVKQHSRNATVFVKKIPAEAKTILEENKDLCSSFEYYTARYHEPVSRMISLNICNALVKEKIISAEQLLNNEGSVEHLSIFNK